MVKTFAFSFIQVEREVQELRQGEEYPEDRAAPREVAATAPGDPGSAAPEPPTDGTDHGEESLASVEAPTGSPMDEPLQHDMGRKQDEQKEKEQVEEGKEQEARGEVAKEPYSPGEGPENLPNPTDHCRVPQERPESLGSPGSTPSDQKEEAGNALLEPQPEESSGETTVGAPQVEGTRSQSIRSRKGNETQELIHIVIRTMNLSVTFTVPTKIKKQ